VVEKFLQQRHGEEGVVAHEMKDDEGMPSSHAGPEARHQLGQVMGCDLRKVAHLKEVLGATLDAACIPALSVQ
jgi:hypothetical protein